jgi:hypothetical protein
LQPLQQPRDPLLSPLLTATHRRRVPLARLHRNVMPARISFTSPLMAFYQTV